ncbi:hypothetical protein OAN24_03445 [Pseudodesulfovibrio sp.]|nr:hypothetical protein [Pseudodesulfovibrio sp.]
MTEQKQTNGIDNTTRIFFYLCVGFCVSFFLWASVAPLDIVSDAIGEVIPSSRVKRIQHLEGGIVREIKVREGDVVEVGQPLIDLEATASDSTVEELNVRVTSLKTEIARLEAESRWFDAPEVASDTKDEKLKRRLPNQPKELRMWQQGGLLLIRSVLILFSRKTLKRNLPAWFPRRVSCMTRDVNVLSTTLMPKRKKSSSVNRTFRRL